MANDWQLDELNQQLSEDRSDEETYFLTNPKCRQDIDKTISECIWPSVIKSTQRSSIVASLGKEDEGVRENIKTPYSYTTTRELTFLLSDPERPIGSGSSRWLCRGTIRCSASDYLLSFDFYLYLPITFNMTKILRLLKHPHFAGMPPTLSYEKRSTGVEEFILSFSKGHGHGGGPLHYCSLASEQMLDEMESNINLIYAVNNLEIDYDRDESFDQLCEAVINAYECY